MQRRRPDVWYDLFPAVLVGDPVQDPTTGAWHHAFVELLPIAPDVYGTQPGSRSGTTDLNYALALPNRPVPGGTPVWLRHRDQNDQLVYEFLATDCCCSVCYQGVDVTGPALVWVDELGGWQAIDLTSAQGALMASGGVPSVQPLYGSGAPAAGVGVAGSIYFDVQDPSNPLFWWKD